MSMQAIKIHTDGTIERVTIIGETIKKQNDSIHKHLGGYFDIVRMGPDAVMLVDDEGLLKQLPLNPAANLISGYPSPLVGTALIVGTQPGPDGDEFCDVPERLVKFVRDLIAAAWEEDEDDE